MIFFHFEYIVLIYLLHLLSLVLLLQFVELKSFSVLFTDVFARGKTIQVEDEMEHFFIAGLMVERNNRNSVIDLISEGVNRVVDDDHVFHVSVRYDPQVLHVIPFWSLNAVLSVKTILE